VTAPEPVDESKPEGPAPAESVGPLPDAVRSRVIILVADALGRLPAEHLPPALKRVAAFARNRRARLAGSQIAGVLETDDAFRERVATQVRTQTPELAQALEDGTPPAAADPVELAALAYLLRPADWVSVVEGAATVADAERAAAGAREANEQAERLRRQLDEVTAELRGSRERYKQHTAELKAENADLRRKVGDARSTARAAEVSAAHAETARDEVTRAASSAASAADAELRRLRARVEELEREVAAARRISRVEKDTATLRARLLLDTLLDAAQGLRRELALPTVEGSPADAVEADVATQGSRSSTGHGSLTTDDPLLLDQLLSLPRAHMIVDGYNVTKNAWPDSSLEVQRDRLLAGLAPLVARSGAEVTVVFDAAEKAERPVVNRPRGVRVLFSPVGVIADDVIRDLVAAEPPGRPVVVVSSDQEVVRDVARSGARPVAAPALSRLLART
jgi:predicted RNA-binding protein with PIN domain